eukprot:Skav234578  [mRNA]  locus=scaffold2869:210260:238859:- [translate_table: standard]
MFLGHMLKAAIFLCCRTFVPIVPWADEQTAIRLVDWDLDGDLDAIGVKTNGSVSFYEFIPKEERFVERPLLLEALPSDHRLDVEVADWDSDGDLDLIQCAWDTQSLVFFESLGNGSFAPHNLSVTFAEPERRSTNCLGTVMVLDEQAMPLTRAWCLFEVLQTFSKSSQQPHFQGQHQIKTFGDLVAIAANQDGEEMENFNRTESVGLKSWFAEHVSDGPEIGAPRPLSTRCGSFQSQEASCRRQIALEQVQRFASRCQEVDNTVLFSSRSSPNLAMAMDADRGLAIQSESAGFHKDNCGILWHKEDISAGQEPSKPSTSPTCLACCDATLVVSKLVSSFRTAIGHGDLGIEDPGFQDPANAVIIFDWDDTLLPTTYILGTVIPSLPEEDRSGVLPENSEYQDRCRARAARYLPGVDFEALFDELDVPVYYSRQHLSNIPVTYKVDNWDVHLDRRAGGRIGVDIIREFDGSLAVARIEEQGLMERSNHENPDKAVNGNTEGLAAECRKQQELRITVYRAVPDRDPYVEAKRIDMTACLDKFYGRHANWKQNVVCIGDAVTEQQAIKEVLLSNSESSRPRPLCKTVNLIDTPTLEQLSNELRILGAQSSAQLVMLQSSLGSDFDLFMDQLGTKVLVERLDDLEAELFKA